MTLSHPFNWWQITRECANHMTPAAPSRICLNKCRTDEPMLKQVSSRTANIRSLTLRTRSFSTLDYIVMHAKNGKNTTFWTRPGKISKLISPLSINFTASRHKMHNQQVTKQQITHSEACRMRYWLNSMKR
jgi:hypothetical protein